MNDKIVCVSGGFDPVHIGHLRMMLAAAEYGKVVVIVNSDEWLMRKKGYIFMPFEERCEILKGFACVTDTVPVNDDDSTVCEALKRIRPHFFANGGDRGKRNTPEMKVCKEYEIELLWSVGGGKVRSSSELVGDSPMLHSLGSGSFDGEIELVPSRIAIISSGDVPKG